MDKIAVKSGQEPLLAAFPLILLRVYFFMGQVSSIKWTDATWNPITGCTKIRLGCDNCYAHRFNERWHGILGHPYEQSFDLWLWSERLGQPRVWRKPRMIFGEMLTLLEVDKRTPKQLLQVLK